MIDLKSVRDGDIERVVEQMPGEALRRGPVYRQGAGGRAVVTYGVRASGHDELRHEVVKQTVVMVGREQHDELGVERLDLAPGLRDDRIDGSGDLLAGIVQAPQRRVRKALQQSGIHAAVSP